MHKLTNEQRKKFYSDALNDQKHLLRSAIAGMQKGDLAQALTIATVIRVLVHETGRSKPLLKQLKPNFLDLRIPSNKSRVKVPAGAKMVKLIYCPLAVRVATEEPLISLGNDLGSYTYESLGTW